MLKRGCLADKRVSRARRRSGLPAFPNLYHHTFVIGWLQLENSDCYTRYPYSCVSDLRLHCPQRSRSPHPSFVPLSFRLFPSRERSVQALSVTTTQDRTCWAGKLALITFLSNPTVFSNSHRTTESMSGPLRQQRTQLRKQDMKIGSLSDFAMTSGTEYVVRPLLL